MPLNFCESVQVIGADDQIHVEPLAGGIYENLQVFDDAVEEESLESPFEDTLMYVAIFFVFVFVFVGLFILLFTLYG